MNGFPPDRRDTDIPVGDTARILAILYTIGFFAIVITLMLRGIPAENKDAINLLLGMLGLIQAGIVKFYFDGTKAAETSIKAGIAGRLKADDALQNIALKVPELPPAPVKPIVKTETMQVAAEQVNVQQPENKS